MGEEGRLDTTGHYPSGSSLLRLGLVVGIALAFAVPSAAYLSQPGAAKETRVPGSSGPSGVQPASSPVTNTYTVTMTGQKNQTGTSETISSSSAWTVGSGGYYNSPSFSFPSAMLSWNGTMNFQANVQLEFEVGSQASSGFCTANVGIIYLNVTVGSHVSSTHSLLELSTSGGTCPNTMYVSFAGKVSVPVPSSSTPTLSLAADPQAGFSWSENGPVGLRSVVVTGAGRTSSSLLSSWGSAGNFPLDWGWSWPNSVAVGSSFSSFSPAASSLSISWSSPYDVNSTYNSVTQSEMTSGTFTGSASVSTISFQPGRADPASIYSFSVTYTTSEVISEEFILTYNYTQPWTGGAEQKTTQTYGATEVSPWNATWSEYTYTIPTPYSNITRIWVAASTSWPLVSAWPGNDTYYSANNTVTWPSAGGVPPEPALSPDSGAPIGGAVPLSVQVVYLAPLQYGSADLTIIYIPSSPIFSLFGASLPYSSVETYVDGIYEPYQTIPASLGQTYSIQTYDIFNHLISTKSVTVNSSSQVESITLNIWPMSIVNLNSSYVVALNIQNYGVTQIAPDLMPLQSYVFYLPQGDYNFTIQYLAFGGGAVGSPTTFLLNISGVSYDVINGLTFLSVIANEQSVGNNLTKVITGVNLTLLSTSANLENLIESLSTGLFSYHFDPGTASRTGGSFSVPVSVTTGAGAVANISATQQMAQTLALTYINQTGTFDIPAFASGATAGQFTLSFTLTKSEIAALEGGTSAMLLSGTATFGSVAAIGTGVIAGAEISGAIEVGQPVNPLSQDVYLDLANETHNGSSGYYTDRASWVNDFNQTYTGEFTLIGNFLGGSSVSLTVNGTVLPPSNYAVTDTGLVIFAGALSVPVGTTLDFAVSYERSSSFSVFGTTLIQFGGLNITTPLLIILLAAVVVVACGIEDYRKRDSRLTRVLAASLFFAVFGAMFMGL
jgi:hypothetical protein